MKRLVVAITGASGAMYGIRLLQWLRESAQVETHLMISDAGVLSMHYELDMKRKDVEALADVVHSVRDVGACVASGSFQSEGMIVAPCSMKTLGSVAHGLSDNLISRAADVMLKERRRLVLMVRETPFNLAHLRNMTAVTEMGGIIYPPLPALYQKPQSIEEMVDHTAGRVLDLFGIEQTLAPQWQGIKLQRAES
ncbi:MAG: UbiX family flavin prenyltransferase [Burkholderiaceae bacterium]|jgi:4-hydroxy-3-polyprenylbenzoate decarboxylase|nr:UbiX family flavin prenyltransferase [Polynucleobacter sp.]MCF8187416.1 UbiX family flavin prenyltransferase [Sulfuritalea sp.]